jgi:hypothetical protein
MATTGDADAGGSPGVCHLGANTSRFFPVFPAPDAPFMASNSNTAEGSVICGAVRLSTSSPNDVFIDYQDANDNTFSWSNVACRVVVMGFNGALLFNDSRTPAAPNFTGTSFFHVPIPAGILGYVWVNCRLPRKDDSSGLSSVFYGFNMQ